MLKHRKLIKYPHRKKHAYKSIHLFAFNLLAVYGECGGTFGSCSNNYDVCNDDKKEC